jgi:transcriptional regulator GlxA family with amidase domain
MPRCELIVSIWVAPEPAQERFGAIGRFSRGEQLAEVACLSPRQFRRVFRAHTGETPAGAVERLRVEAAKPRVETGREPISLIGASVGFADPERMRRAFIRQFGLSPQAVRRAATRWRSSARVPGAYAQAMPSPARS